MTDMEDCEPEPGPPSDWGLHWRKGYDDYLPLEQYQEVADILDVCTACMPKLLGGGAISHTFLVINVQRAMGILWGRQIEKMWGEISQNPILASAWQEWEDVDVRDLPDDFRSRLLIPPFTKEDFVRAFLDAGLDPKELTLKWRHWAQKQGIHHDFPPKHSDGQDSAANPAHEMGIIDIYDLSDSPHCFRFSFDTLEERSELWVMKCLLLDPPPRGIDRDKLAERIITFIWNTQISTHYELLRKECPVLAEEWTSPASVDPFSLPSRLHHLLLGLEKKEWASCPVAFDEEEFVRAYCKAKLNPQRLTPKWQQWAYDEHINPEFSEAPFAEVNAYHELRANEGLMNMFPMEPKSLDREQTAEPVQDLDPPLQAMNGAEECITAEAVPPETGAPPKRRKARQSYQVLFTPPLTAWSDLTFSKDDTETSFTVVRKSTGEKQTILMEPAGLTNSKGHPTVQGELLLHILTTRQVEEVRNNTRISLNDKTQMGIRFGEFKDRHNPPLLIKSHIDSALKQRVRRLELILKAMFGLEEDPIPHTLPMVRKAMKGGAIGKNVPPNYEHHYNIMFNIG